MIAPFGIETNGCDFFLFANQYLADLLVEQLDAGACGKGSQQGHSARLSAQRPAQCDHHDVKYDLDIAVFLFQSIGEPKHDTSERVHTDIHRYVSCIFSNSCFF